MHAWVCDNPVGVDALNWRELATPQPGPGEVLIEVKAASLNFPDLLLAQGKYQIRPTPPFVPGAEFAGVVKALGDGAAGFGVGDHVACLALSGTGGFGTHTTVPAALCTRMPPTVPFVDAATFIMIYGTAYHALVHRGAIKAGETVLVLGAAGGVGSAAIQVAKAAGATVIAATSTDEKCAVCKSTGADATINYCAGSLREAIKALTDGNGPDVIFDPVGGEFSEPAFRSIAWRGRHLVVGFAAGAIPALPWNLALLKGASIVGVRLGDLVHREPATNRAMLTLLAQWYSQGKIKPVIDRVCPMSDLKAAYARMGSRGILGKLVMVN